MPVNRFPAIRELDQGLDRLIGETFREPEPPVLYHLTGSVEAVEGILSTGIIRATISLKVRGDDEELLAGERIAEDVARAMLASASSVVSREALGRFVGGFGRQRISAQAEVFVSCFTPEIGPVHWERYANGGEWFALGFAVLPDRQRPRRPDVTLLTIRVHYDPDVVRARLRRAFSLALQLAGATNRKCRAFEPTVRLATSTLNRIAALTAVQTKRRKFDDENEWRIVAVPMPTASGTVVRTGDSAFFPVDLNLGDQPVVHEVLVGPNHPEPAAAVDAVRRILSAAEYPSNVIASQWRPGQHG